LDFVTFIFQVSAHGLEYQSVVPSKYAVNIFTNDPAGLHFSYASKHLRPEVAVVRRAFSLSGCAEWLAWESTCKDVNSASPNSEICGIDVGVGGGIGPVVF
jgi:hypothetical protein